MQHKSPKDILTQTESLHFPITAWPKAPIRNFSYARTPLHFPCQGKLHVGLRFKYENKDVKVARGGQTDYKAKNHIEKQ